MKRTNRLLALERAVKAAEAASTIDQQQQQCNAEHAALFQARWRTMRATMSEEHARLVEEAYAAGWQFATSDGFRMPAASLLRRCLNALYRSDRQWPDSEVRPEVVLAMPPQVAEVYLQDRDALPLHDCEECGYRVPHGYFDHCPLCGGRVGWNAYWQKHKDDPRPA